MTTRECFVIDSHNNIFIMQGSMHFVDFLTLQGNMRNEKLRNSTEALTFQWPLSSGVSSHVKIFWIYFSFQVRILYRFYLFHLASFDWQHAAVWSSNHYHTILALLLSWQWRKSNCHSSTIKVPYPYSDTPPIHTPHSHTSWPHTDQITLLFYEVFLWTSGSVLTI